MKFTVLSHAGMLVEAGGVKLVTDPWILGSSYWRSWWNYPKPATFSTDGIEYIYLTHMHWDHFHGPSLRKFPPSVTFLVPQAPTGCLLNDLRDFPCKSIIELPHGKTLQLSPTLRITSYQQGLNTDSALIIDDGNTVLANLNDCKLAGAPLRQVLRRHPKIDFLFRSHSSAQPYPHCVEAEDPDDLQYRKNEDYVADFVESATLIKPRYAIPFASNNCFLHRETFRFNDLVVNPLDVKLHFDRQERGSAECVVMVAGDSWDDQEGFHIRAQDFFTNKEQRLREYAQETAPILEEYYKRESTAKVTFPAFSKYFNDFMSSMPWFLRPVFKPVVVFEPEGQNNSWVLDFRQRRVYEANEAVVDYDVKFRAHPAVLRDCVQRKMFTLFFPSKRLRISLKRGHVKDYFIFEQLFDLYEYGLLPLRNCFSRRSLLVWLRRWREVVAMIALFFRVLWSRNRRDGISDLVPRTTL
jgi:UDP-MurNAc hydroxylase